ncbi:hypothetical protein FMUND_6454 [Fusarium mundagurra]|uniref:Peptidase C14 caspase domain-containing protein n=1 Tax=Fusarium mundagurra TaxID=1567541 RepID=A0A8H5YPL0_9HYPO|nr:hypothetical protein FMUND_6454 [Fusarium mundagurra]
MQSEAQNRWAVLVGIDQYEPPVSSLSGCCQDAKDASDIVLSRLQVPAENIKMLVAPLGRQIDYSTEDAPTKKNVVQALKNLEQKDPGGFVYFHYSGHGGRDPTKYVGLKGAGQKDETICTWEEYITDVELGDLLDQLALKHTVFVLLDCCHSGGADREGYEPPYLIRSKDYGSEQLTNRGKGHDRNANPLLKSQLYRKRKYNLVAACQPSELASEWRYSKTENGRQKSYSCGAMTHFFLQALEKLSSSQDPVTYGQLLNVVEVEFKSNAVSLDQKPMHLGERDRILFATEALSNSSRGMANVISKDQNSVTLNKGSSKQVTVGDSFLLYPPSQVYLGLFTDDTSGTEICITSVKDFESTAIVAPNSSGSLNSVETGWFARLNWRVNRKTVHVQLPLDDNHDALNRIQKEWKKYVDPYAPYDLVFTPPVIDADFAMYVDENQNFRLRDKAKEEMTLLPLISAYSDNNVEELMGLLNHLSSYQLVADIAQGSGGRRPNFEYGIEEAPKDEQNPESLGSWRFWFKNLSSTPLYVTIIALGPAYRINEVFPFEFAPSSEIAGKEEFPPDVFVDIDIPDLLDPVKNNSDFKMSDRFKIFITNTLVDFRDYKLPDLTKDPSKLRARAANRANVRRPRFSAWVVEEVTITTERRSNGSYITYESNS